MCLHGSWAPLSPFLLVLRAASIGGAGRPAGLSSSWSATILYILLQAQKEEYSTVLICGWWAISYHVADTLMLCNLRRLPSRHHRCATAPAGIPAEACHQAYRPQ